MEPISGYAAEVPFTALPPAGGTERSAPLIVTWHMLDAPRTDAAFAAALPMNRVPAWRVHLGMPMCGARMVDGRVDAVVELIHEDPLMAYLAPFVSQAVDEFPAALAALRQQLPVDDGPIGLLGASLGATVALEVLLGGHVPISTVALVNPAVRIRSAVGVIEAQLERPYPWTSSAHETADHLDFITRVDAGLPARPPLLLISGERDHRTFRDDASALVDALRGRYERPDDVELANVADLPHSLADEPGLEPVPQLPRAITVDRILTHWYLRQFAAA